MSGSSDVSPNCTQCGRPFGPSESGCPACLVRLAFDSEFEDSNSLPIAEPVPGLRIRYFGNYELLNEIGRGGMGVVWRARQLNLDRIVAVKRLLFGEFSHEDARQRFRTEAMAAAGLRHPGIVSIHEIGEQDGEPFFSMDYIEGSSLADLIRGQPMAPRRAAQLLHKVAEAVEFAHQRHILHRDLKPSNIVVDLHDEPHLTDFGLARRIGKDLGPTKSGDVLGSPNYMPPEQARGDGRNIQVTADVYSLGAILYHLLSGRPPFAADSLEATLLQVIHDDPVPLRRLNPSVPVDLETVCLKCLSKETSQRYASAGAFKEELQAWMEGRPIAARPISRFERARRWSIRHPLPAFLATAIAMLLVTIAFVATVAAVRLDRVNRKLAISERESISKLWEYKVAESRTRQMTPRSGRRFDSLQLLKWASSAEPAPSLRDEVIATLGLADIQITQTLNTNGVVLLHPTVDRSLRRWGGATTNGTIEIRDLKDGGVILTLPAVGGGVAMVHRFPADGEDLCATYADGVTRVWDLKKHEVRFSFQGTERFEAVHYSNDNLRMAAVVDRTNIVVWSRPDGKIMATHPVSFPAHYVSFSPDGHRIVASAYDDGRVELFESEGIHLGTLSLSRAAGEAAWHPGGRLIAVASLEGPIFIWDTAAQEITQTLVGHQAAAGNVVFSPDGRHLVSSGWDGTILWELATGQETSRIPGLSARLMLDTGGQNCVACVWEKTIVHVCQVSFAPEARLIPVGEMAEKVKDFALHPRANVLAAAAGTAVRLLDSETGRELARLPTGPIQELLFTPDGSQLIVGGSIGVQSWSIQETDGRMVFGPPTRLLSIPGEGVTALALSANGRTLAAAHRLHCHIFDLETKMPVSTNGNTPGTHIHRLGLSHDGRWLASSGWNSEGTLVWDTATGRLRNILHDDSESKSFGVPAFDPQGRWLSLAFSDQVHKFDPVSGRTLAKFPIGKGYDIGSDRSGEVLALRDSGSDLALADASDGGILARLRSHVAPGNARFHTSHDDSSILIQPSSKQGAILVWDLSRIRPQLAELKLDWKASVKLPPRRSVSSVSVMLDGSKDPAPLDPRTMPVAGILPRDSNARPQLIDLTGFLNATLDENWHQDRLGNDYRELPRGVQSLGGIDFEIRGLIQLSDFTTGYRPYPRVVSGIPIQQSARQVHFLHGSLRGGDVNDRARIGHYLVRFEDGREIEVPIVLGRDVNDWWSTSSESIAPRIAWQGSNPESVKERRSIRLFRSTWSNPRPAVRISSVDFVSGDHSCTPFLVAITVEN